MEDKLNLIDSSYIDESEASNSNNHGWQKVTYAKKNRKQKPDAKKSEPAGEKIGSGGSVFTSLEKQAEERRRRIEAQKAAIFDGDDDEAAKARSAKKSDGESDGEVVVNGAAVEEKKKVKVKKVKKPKITVAEAAAKIDADDLAAFLAEISVSCLILICFV